MKIFSTVGLTVFVLVSGSLFHQVSGETLSLDKSTGALRLTMKESIALSIKNNLEIAIERISPLISEDEIEKNKAKFDSSFSLSVNGEKNRTPSSSAFSDPKVGTTDTFSYAAGTKKNFITGTDVSFDLLTSQTTTNSRNQSLNPEYNSSLSVSFTQHLLRNFGRDINGSAIQIATKNREISQFQFKNKVLNIVSDVKNTYWDLFYAIEDLKVRQENMNLARQFEERVRTQVKIGVLAPIEITSAMAEVASREEDVITGQKNIADVEDRLKRLSNMDTKYWDSPIIPVDSPEVTAADGDIATDMKDAYDSRPDYLQAKLRLESDNITLAYKENQLYPELDLSATIKMKGISGDAQDVTFGTSSTKSEFDGDYFDSYSEGSSGKYYDWKVGLTLNIPLGNRSAKSAYKTAKLLIEKNVKTLKNIEQRIKLDVREARRRVSTALKRIDVTAVAQKLAKEKLAAEETRFKLGMSTSFNVLEYQRDLSDARRKELLAKADYNKALVHIDLVTGRLLDRHQITIESY